MILAGQTREIHIFNGDLGPWKNTCFLHVEIVTVIQMGSLGGMFTCLQSRVYVLLMLSFSYRGRGGYLEPQQRRVGAMLPHASVTTP
jgi:hypothetical protein